MIKVTFICLGNICRSPMAELLFKKLVKERGVSERFEIASCATSGYEAGNAIYPPARQTLRAHGIEGSHVSRKVTKSDIQTSDYLLVMDENNLRDMRRVAPQEAWGKIYKLCSFTSRPRDVADPWYTGDFEQAYSDIAEGCACFLDWVLKGQ